MGCDCSKSREKETVPVVLPPPPPQPLRKPIRRKSDTPVDLFPQAHFTTLAYPFASLYRVTASLAQTAVWQLNTVEYLASQLPCRVTVLTKEKVQGRAAQRLRLTEEARRLVKLDHPHTLKLLELLQDMDSFYAVCEGCPGGSLQDCLSDPHLRKSSVLVDLVKQLLSALAYVHGREEVHGQLSPAHVLLVAGLDELQVKVAGFGQLDSVLPCEKAAHFLAPEYPRTDKADIWSLGLIIYTILAGQTPFKAAENDMLQTAKLAPINLSHLGVKDSPLLDFLTLCLHPQPASRPSALQLRQHPWLLTYTRRPASTVYRSTLQQLRSYRPSNPLRDAISHFILYRLTSERLYVDILGVFEYLNPGSGQLGVGELTRAYAQMQSEKQAAVTAPQVLASVDVNGSGSVSFSEFLLAAISPDRLLSAENIRSAFKCFDSNGDGEVSLEEFRRILTVKSSGSVEKKWRELMVLADRTGNGKVDLREFTQLMLEQDKY